MLQNEVNKRIGMATKLHLHGINACLTEGGHAIIVVQGRVHAVDTNYIDFEFLEEWKISLASVSLSKRVNEVRRFSEWIVSRSHHSP